MSHDGLQIPAPLRTTFYEPFGDKPAPTGVLVVLCLSMIGLGSFLSVTRLQTEITHDGIRYKFSPLQRTFVVIPFYEMRTLCVRKYRPRIRTHQWLYLNNGRLRVLDALILLDDRDGRCSSINEHVHADFFHTNSLRRIRSQPSEHALVW